MPPAVQEAHRPTLHELLAPRPPAVRRALAGAALVALLAVVIAVLVPKDDGIDVVRTSPLAFNFRHPPELRPVDPRPGEILRLEQAQGGLFIQSFALERLELPPYKGDVSGMLPAFATGEIERLRERYAQFELLEESKTRVNKVAGYSIVFRSRLGRRRLYTRVVLLPEGVAGARRGVRMVLEATPASGIGQAREVGIQGLTKLPFRSFRFGTEKP